MFFHEPGKLPEQGGFYTPSPFLPSRSNSAAKNATIKVQSALPWLHAAPLLLPLLVAAVQCLQGNREVLWAVLLVQVHCPLHDVPACGQVPAGKVRNLGVMVGMVMGVMVMCGVCCVFVCDDRRV